MHKILKMHESLAPIERSRAIHVIPFSHAFGIAMDMILNGTRIGK